MTARSILIVDDETASAQALADSPTALGYRVAANASSRAEALELAVIHHPDLAVMNPRLAVEIEQLSDEALRQGNESERRCFALSLDLLCFNGFDGAFKRLNPAWERTLGYTLEELSSRPFIDFVHPDDGERTLAQNREVRAGG
jgi:PAS domain-containing protein